MTVSGKSKYALPVFHENFAKAAAAASGNDVLRAVTTSAALKKDGGRKKILAELPDAEGLRALAKQIKSHVLDNFDYYLAQFADKVRAAGGVVHFAATAAEANQKVVNIARENNCRVIVKVKSMATEETQLNAALSAAGMTPIETDLGEFIVQLAEDRPSHLIMPVMHMNRQQIGKLFAKFFGVPYTDDPPTLAEMARVYLRDRFNVADMGVSGVNFGIAETGSIVICTNEGNGRMCTTRPRVHVALMGMEKLLPRFADLGVFLKLMARSASGIALTQYTNIITGPRRPEEHDGPHQLHIVILDNGRRRILGSEYRDVLRCLRCGACLNACPVYRTIGGHAYGTTLPGPIGSLLAPLLNGIDRHPDLPQASSLCGACLEACPVQIDIPELLIHMRRDLAAGAPPSTPAPPHPTTAWTERVLFGMWTFMLATPWRYRLAQAFQKFFLRHLASSREGWISRLPGPAKGWTQARDFPVPPERTFRQWWKERRP
jgi:L-lactate dehydrogenase complex protein LldF